MEIFWDIVSSRILSAAASALPFSMYDDKSVLTLSCFAKINCDNTRVRH
jgi:hypothetical protein